MYEEIKKLTEDGMSARKISQKLKIDFKEIQNIITKNNFAPLKIKFTEIEKDNIIELYKQGVSAKTLAKKYNIRKQKIINWTKELGIFRTSNESTRLHIVNEHCFDNFKTEEQAYWLGFLYADVYNNEKGGAVTLQLKGDDVNHVIKYVNFIGGDINDIKNYTSKNGHKISKYNINSIYLSEKLRSLGCPQRKSFIIKYPDWLPKNLNNHFIRGYFDGDGCLTFRKKQKEYKFSIVGTKELCESLKEIYKEECNIDINYRYISKTGNNTYELESSGNQKIEKICDYLYRNATIFLERKQEKYLELKNMNDSRRSRIFDKMIIINKNIMNTSYLNNLSKEEKEKLVEPIVNYFVNSGFVYPDNFDKVTTEYKNLIEAEVDLTKNSLDNHSRLGTYICKYYCKSFYSSTTIDNNLSLLNSFTYDNLKKVTEFKLKLIHSNIDSMNFSYQTMVDALRDARICAQISIFKPIIAKYMCLKYSEPGDVVGDYSCGFGARMLGATSCGRKYVGTDPLTVPELQKMANDLELKDVKLINYGSEYYKGEENSIDLYWSSPPYYDLERYSNLQNQAYSKGENHFYNIYWRNTLENIKYMLKPNKWFGVNVSDKHYKMVEIAKEYFGEIIEEVNLESRRYHYAGQKFKIEKIFMFKNLK